MPCAHKQHVYHEAALGNAQAFLKQLMLQREARETHEHEVAQPKRERDMPTVPEIFNIDRQKRCAEVARRANTEAIARAHRHEAVASEIEEQIEAVLIGNDDLLPQFNAEPRISPPVRVIEAEDIGGDNHLIDHACRNKHYASSKKPCVFVTRARRMKILDKTTAAVDRPRGEHRKEHDEAQPIARAHALDDAIVHLNNNLGCLKRQI